MHYLAQAQGMKWLWSLSSSDAKYDRFCSYLFPGNSNYAQDLRSPLANVVVNKCPVRKGTSGLVRKLYASDFQSTNVEHLMLVKDMGISIVNLPDGRVQLLHSLANVIINYHSIIEMLKGS